MPFKLDFPHIKISFFRFFVLKIKRAILWVRDFFITERKILLVTKSKIITINLGLFLQISVFLIVMTTALLIGNSFNSHQKIIAKSLKIIKLKSLQ